MKLRCLHVPGPFALASRLISCAIAPLLLSPVAAAPIQGPFWVLDTPLSVVVSFSGSSPSTTEIGPFVSPSGFWRVASIDITDSFFIRNLMRIEEVEIVAMLQHAKGPHDGEGAGPVFEFSFAFDASEGPVNSTSSNPLPQAHAGLNPPHIDEADAVVHFSTDAALQNIKIFNITMEENHLVPEPGGALLMISGLVLMVGGLKAFAGSGLRKNRREDGS